MPWNFPLWQVFRFLAPALMAGNIGLLKHASNVPQCALAIEALVRRAGFPRGVFQALLIEARQVETSSTTRASPPSPSPAPKPQAAPSPPRPAGSSKNPSSNSAAPTPSSSCLPPTSTLAVHNAVKARCINNGQSCIAAKRFSSFTRHLRSSKNASSPAWPPSTSATPCSKPPTSAPSPPPNRRRTPPRSPPPAPAAASSPAAARLLERDGNYFQPTVIAGLTPNAPICHEEIFGPVALLFRVASLDEAIAIANDTPFGLAASAWTADDAERQRLAAELQCGAVFFNTIVASDPRLPFGGIKRSGYGRELCAVGMREFLNAKTVVVAEPRSN